MVSRALRDTVVFERHNLQAEDGPPRGWYRFDAVICRNVLIYLDAADARRVIGNLVSAIRPGGFLVVGATERPLLWQHHGLTGLGDAVVQVGGQPEKTVASSPRIPVMHEPQRRNDDVVRDALMREQAGNPEQAIATLESALTRTPRDEELQLALGLTLKRAGQPVRAIAALKAARRLDPGTWLAAFELGVCLAQVGETEAARTEFRAAIRLIDAGASPGMPTEGDKLANMDLSVRDSAIHWLERLDPG